MLGMSGGVDSSVAALLLTEQGYRVHGVTLQVWEHEDDTVARSKRWQERGCCKVGVARYVAKRLGITHEVIDTREAFRAGVIDDFLSGYLAGTTPNPCVRCNERVKLRLLHDLGRARGVDCVATGHYARILMHEGRPSLYRSSNATKDQSYFLYRLKPEWLPSLRFPVGDMQKSEVYTRAEDLGLPADELKESQEICFVSEGNYRSFVEREAPQAKRPGLFLDETGRPIGEHDGVAFYTRGQRRGLGVATGRRLYVQTVVPQTNTVVLGPEETLLQAECRVSDLNRFDDRIGDEPVDVEAKVRYATPSSPATLEPASGDGVLVRFRTPQRALSPGQSAVFYCGDRVLGGGIIREDFRGLPS